MTNEQLNIKPNGTEEVSSLLILKTIFEIQANEVLTMAKESNNEGMPTEANAGIYMYVLLLDVIDLLQAAINNDFEAMRGNFTDVGALALRLREIDEQNGYDRLLDALNALCPDDPNLAFFVWQTSMEMIEDDKSTGLHKLTYPKTQANTGPNRAQRRQTARKKKKKKK
jgi:hypothetical protein